MNLLGVMFRLLFLYEHVQRAYYRSHNEQRQRHLLCRLHRRRKLPSCGDAEEESAVAREEVGALGCRTLAVVAAVEQLVELFRRAERYAESEEHRLQGCVEYVVVCEHCENGYYRQCVSYG